MSKISVVLAPSYEQALSVKAAATVEAEYGENVVLGKKVTLAHHVEEYKDQPPPCLFKGGKLKSGDTILVSHLDLDAIGGCLALMGVRPEDDEFWEAAAFIDIKGPHHLRRLSERQQKMLNAYWAWNSIQRQINYTEVTDVTKEVLKSWYAINNIIAEVPQYIKAGVNWSEGLERAVEQRKVYESDKVRGFITKGLFCSSSYYSPSLKNDVAATVSMNPRYKSIIVSFADAGEKISAKNFVQNLWGDEAGGRDGIAGSPRGWKISEEELEKEFYRTIEVIEAMA